MRSGAVGGAVAIRVGAVAGAGLHQRECRRVRSVGTAFSRRVKQHRSRATTTQRLTLTIREAVEILGISVVSAYECVQRGEVPSLAFGRRIVITRRDLEHLLDQLTDDPDGQVSA